MTEPRTEGEPSAVGPRRTSDDIAPLVDLRDPAAVDPAATGAKAAALARAAAAGLPTLPGLVLTTAFTDDVDAGAQVAGHPALRDLPRALVTGSDQRLIVRSSSTAEDGEHTSQAGQFASVAPVDGPDELAMAVQVVLDSRRAPGAPADAAMAVLVQPYLDVVVGGVMFGVDPVSGRRDRRVVSAVRDSVEGLVSGTVAGSRYVVDPAGGVVERDRGDGPALSRRSLRRLVRLADRAAALFGGPQDIEWAIDRHRRLWLLQSRPVTTEVRGVPIGPVYGPGPVAETFPEPLTELEHDLWVPPLRDAVRHAVVLAGAASHREIAASGVVVQVEGHVAIDLHLAGQQERHRGIAHHVDPRPALHRLRGTWRVGRLRAALPSLAEHLLSRTDADLRRVPELGDLSARQLVALLHRARDVLRALHAHEVLMGLLTDAGSTLTGASVALRVLGNAREEGLTDAEIVERYPVVLAVTAPRVGPRPDLAPGLETGLLGDGPAGDPHENEAGVLREALRLRVRWVQELGGRAAWELGQRLHAEGLLTDPERVRHLHLEDLDAVATHRGELVPALLTTHEDHPGPALPARFRISDTGRPIRVREGEAGGGTGAGGGVGRGVVTHDAADPPEGSVLVTTTLTPGLGPLLSRLEGIVAETGSVLSHLAILAREAGVATVVGYPAATEELAEGSVVVVDGHTGNVTIESTEARS